MARLAIFLRHLLGNRGGGPGGGPGGGQGGGQRGGQGGAVRYTATSAAVGRSAGDDEVIRLRKCGHQSPAS